MTDRHNDDDERAAEAVLAGLEGERDAVAGVPASDADETLRRLYLETLGLLAYDAEPATPPPELKARLMAALADEEEGGPDRAEDQEPARDEESADADTPEGALPFGPTPEESPPASWTPDEEGPGRRPGGRLPAWVSAVAAVVALAAIGLAGFLWAELESSRDAIARLEQDQQRLTARFEERTLGAEGPEALAELVSAVTMPGVEMCPMRPVGDPPLVPGAFAVLYMPPGERAWYVVARDLEPRDAGVYRVWLHTSEGAVPVGVIEPGGRSSLRLPAESIDPEEMLSVSITVERTGDAAEPDGPMVLFGDEKMQVL